MAKRGLLIALFVLPFVAGLRLATPAAALDTDCAGTPADAVMMLPAPLSKWAQVSCTPFGHIVGARTGWAWVSPNGVRSVFIPSQSAQRSPLPLGNQSYFTKIEIERVKGEEFDRVYEIFHKGFDTAETKPDGYRAELTPAKGDPLIVYFFDYDTYAWGMECEKDDCDPDSRFAILDKAHQPKLRGPSI